MLTTENWVPIDGIHEANLIYALNGQNRRFIKPLPYDTRNMAAFSTVPLLDTGDNPMPLNVISRFMTENERSTRSRSIITAGAQGWVWVTGDPMPELPPAVSRSSS